MGIVIKNPEIVPSVSYDHIHLLDLNITQPLMQNVSSHPVYNLRVSYKAYGIGEDGTLYYERRPSFLNLPDYLTKAMIEAQGGNPTLINALQSIEAALATIIEHTGQHGAVEVK